MGDTNGIDRVFDFLDGAIEKVDRVINRSKYTEDQHRIRQAKTSLKGGGEAASRTQAPVSKGPQSSTLVKRPRYYITEMIDATSGQTIFVVTDGGNARAECASREMALQIQQALEAVP